MKTFDFTTGANISLSINGISHGVWVKRERIDSELQVKLFGSYINISLTNDYEIGNIASGDLININGIATTGTLLEKFATLKSQLFTASTSGSSTLQQVLDNGSTLTSDHIISMGGKVTVADGDDITRKVFLDIKKQGATNPYIDAKAENNTGQYAETNIYPASLGLLSGNSTSETSIDIYPTTATLTKGGVSKTLQGINAADDFANDAAAATGGIPVGGLYHTSGAVKIRLT